MSQPETKNGVRFTNLTHSQYVFRFGVLGWGVPTAVLFALIQYYRYGGSFLGWLGPAIVLFPLGGVLWGHIVYRLNERKFGKAAPTGGQE